MVCELYGFDAVLAQQIFQEHWLVYDTYRMKADAEERKGQELQEAPASG